MGKPYGYMIVVIAFCILEMMDIGILEFWHVFRCMVLPLMLEVFSLLRLWGRWLYHLLVSMDKMRYVGDEEEQDANFCCESGYIRQGVFIWQFYSFTWERKLEDAKKYHETKWVMVSYIFSILHPDNLGQDDPIWLAHIIQMGLVKPPTIGNGKDKMSVDL